MIESISLEQQKTVCDATEVCIRKAESLFGRSMGRTAILFDLKGKSAGMYRIRNNLPEIRYNPHLFCKYYQDNLINTVAHEVAHFVADQLFGLRNIRPHGSEWKNIMLAFGVTPNRTCNYDMTGIPTRSYATFDYYCLCMTHKLTTRRHNQILRGKRTYSCRQCKSKLQRAHQIK